MRWSVRRVGADEQAGRDIPLLGPSATAKATWRSARFSPRQKGPGGRVAQVDTATVWPPIPGPTIGPRGEKPQSPRPHRRTTAERQTPGPIWTPTSSQCASWIRPRHGPSSAAACSQRARHPLPHWGSGQGWVLPSGRPASSDDLRGRVAACSAGAVAGPHRQGTGERQRLLVLWTPHVVWNARGETFRLRSSPLAQRGFATSRDRQPAHGVQCRTLRPRRRASAAQISVAFPLPSTISHPIAFLPLL